MVRRLLGTSYRVARRIAVAVLGASVLAIGLALTVLPGPAFVVIPLGLAILGLEFAFARRWLRALKSGASSVLGRGGGPGRGSPPGGPLLALLLLLPLLGAGCGASVEIGMPDARSGELRIDVALPSGASPAGARLFLDGEEVSSRFVPGGPGLVGFLPAPPPGAHRLSIFRPVLGRAIGWTAHARFESPAAAPALVASTPRAGESVAPSAWLELVLAEPAERAAAAGWGFGVECGGVRIESRTQLLGRRVVVNPAPALPPGRSCRLQWRGPEGNVSELPFSTADEAEPAPLALYDRTDRHEAAPFPDDYWLVPDASAPAGRRIALELGPFSGRLETAVNGVARALASRDGWSPVQPFVLAFSAAVDGGQLPESHLDSLDPAGALLLFDMDPQSPRYGEPVPFTARARRDRALDGTAQHSVLLFPARELRAGGRYALAVTRRLRVAGRPEHSFGPSPFFQALLAPPAPGEPAEQARARERLAPVLRFLAEAPALPIPPEDLALALSISIRSERFDPSDWVAIKEQALASDPPAFEVEEESVLDGDRVVRGVVRLPSYLEPDLSEVVRDPSGAPLAVDEEAVPFVLRIPGAAARPMPIVIYQHGSPGSPEEINEPANRFLLEAGYALIGIADFANRRFGANPAALSLGMLLGVGGTGHIPLAQLQTHADLMGLLRAIQGMGAAFPEIDTGRIFYRGVSFGAHHALGFLPFAPELTAAVAVVGGGRFFENVLHGIDRFGTLGGLQVLLPDAEPRLLLVGFAALQNDADRDDPQYLARHLYRAPLEVAGQSDRDPPSLLWIEGVGDRVVSNTATRAAAHELGLPQVEPVEERASSAPPRPAPLRGNLGEGRTGGHFQYRPLSTPSCLAALEFEGHFCAQRATEAAAQTLHFFETAAAGSAEIVSPLPRHQDSKRDAGIGWANR